LFLLYGLSGKISYFAPIFGKVLTYSNSFQIWDFWNIGCVNQDGTFNINLSLPPPQSHGMLVVRPPSPALLSQQGIPLGLPQIPCQPHMLNQFIQNMISYFAPIFGKVLTYSNSFQIWDFWNIFCSLQDF
jgi:hypothetical protein